MKIKTISIVYGRKLNLGDYNSAHAGATVWADLEEGDDVKNVSEQLKTLARDCVRKELSRLTKANATPS